MKEDYTHLTVILDRTGAMESIRDDTIGGFNSFLEDHKSQPGIATLTLVQFDTEDPYEVIHHFKLIGAVPKLDRKTYVPRAATPLLDAIGRGIIDLEKSLATMDEAARPANVAMVIVTDGQENSSSEFTKSQITKMIGDKQEAGWQFVFLSADLNAINDAVNTGVKYASSIAYDKNSRGVSEAWASVSLRTSNFRSGAMEEIVFTEEDRSKHDSETQRRKRAKT